MISWSDIPIDLLPNIIKHLEVVDVVRFRAVCNWWRSVSCWEYSRRPQIPWLMLSSKDDDKIKFRYFYSLTEHKIYQISLPEIAGHHCVGSSHGYLLFVDRNANLIATNPLVGGTHLTNYYRKAILSPDADSLVVIQRSTDSLAFARIGDQSWTALKFPLILPQLGDIIFHKGRLYVVDFMGTIAIFDLNHPSDPPFMSPTEPLGSLDGAPRWYLVESPCGESLFVVCRVFKYIGEVKIPRTNNFEVYILDKATYVWNQTKTLGDVSLFLGFNYSMSLCTRELPCIKGNCIYFTSDHIFRPDSASDMGVFNLDDTTIGPLYLDSNLHRLNWLPPLWFMPTLS